MTRINRYAQTQGLTLLEQTVSTVGPIFTVAQARQPAEDLGLGDSQLRWTLSQLARSGWIARIKRGVYAVQSPLLGAELHPFAIAAALVEPLAISHWSALAHHGLITQIPPMVQASTPRTVVTPEMRDGLAHRPRGRAVWQALGLEFEFIRVKQAHFFGFQRVWVSRWHRVAITDLERTALDMVAHPRVFGDLGAVIETIEAHLERLNLENLVEYALRYDVGAVVKRLGWILEALDAPAAVIEPLRAYPVSSYYLLDPTRPPDGPPLARWKIRDNLGRENDDADC